MSKYTGKFDFGDIVEMHYTSKNVLSSKVYIHKSKIDFENNEANLILYYPYLVSSMASSKDDDGSYSLVIFLTDENYIDTIEKKALFDYYLTLKDFWQNGKKYSDLYNDKIFKKYNYFLHKDKMQEIVSKLSTEMKSLKDIMMSTKLKKEYSYKLERCISDKVMSNFHIEYYNDKRKELMKDYENKGGSLHHPLYLEYSYIINV